jgi:hypothetical protein
MTSICATSVAEIATPFFSTSKPENPTQKMKIKLHLLAAAIALSIQYSSASTQVYGNGAHGQTIFGKSGIVAR